jgi:guanylate cyclase
MIPKTVADRIKNGQDPLATCKTFDEVTVIFAEIQESTPDDVGAIQTAMNTVNTLNAAFSAFDEVCKKKILVMKCKI